MSKYSIIIYSKNKTALLKFLTFFKKIFIILKLQIILKYNNIKKKKKHISVLKSPHINKTAQEKFKYTSYSLKISSHSFNIFLYSLYIKKLNNNLFPDIKTKILTTNNNKMTKKLKKNILNINLFLLRVYKIKKKQRLNVKKFYKTNIINYNINLLKKTTNYLKILDCLGEIKEKNKL